MNLQDRVAVVTAAGSGNGRAGADQALAAVYDKGVAGDIGRAVGDQEQDGLGDLVDPAEARQGHTRRTTALRFHNLNLYHR